MEATNTQLTPELAEAPIACVVCRSRKVRCDRKLPSCQNCLRLGISCPGFDVHDQKTTRRQMLKSTDDIFKAAGKERRRIGSCNHCRASKSQCSRDRPSCRRCVSRNLDCQYTGRLGVETPLSRPESVSHVEQGVPSLKPRTIVVSALEIDYDQLCSDTLPNDTNLWNPLITAYLERVHPLRCLGFIHKPSLMHSLHRQSLMEDYAEPLIYIICALGARTLYLDSLLSQSLAHVPGSAIPGDSWAERARREVLVEAHAPTLHHLMAMILLCEYGLRTDRNAKVFVLSGCLFRSLRLLGLDMPLQLHTVPSSSSDFLQQEAENRVVWACYHLDLLLASGVDKDSWWRDNFPLIPLPCPDQNFLSLTPSETYYLAPIEDSVNMAVIRHFDLSSLVTVCMRLRSAVLRLVRTTIPADLYIWDLSSPFMTMIKRLEKFSSNFPERFSITDLNLYMHKDQHMIGAVFFLHLIYHAAAFDLMRVTLAGFTFPLAAAFANAPPDFRFEYQKRCNHHAKAVSNIFKHAFQHGTVALDQIVWADIAFESAKIQIIYSATVDNSSQSVEMAKKNIRTNLRLLDVLHVGKEGQSPYIRALLPLCRLFGHFDIFQEWSGARSSPDAPAEVTGSADINHLSKMAFFRKARSEVRATRSGSSTGGLSIDSEGSPSITEQEVESLSHSTKTPMDITFKQHHPETTRIYRAIESPHSGETSRNGHRDGIDCLSNINLDLSNTMAHGPDLIVQPSVEDYIRAADGINNYLTWDITESSELPSWLTFDLLDPSA